MVALTSPIFASLIVPCGEQVCICIYIYTGLLYLFILYVYGVHIYIVRVSMQTPAHHRHANPSVGTCIEAE